MVRGSGKKILPTILFDFWVLGELGPQKGAKKAIWALCRSIFRPWWPIAITHQKCAHTSSGAQNSVGGQGSDCCTCLAIARDHIHHRARR